MQDSIGSTPHPFDPDRAASRMEEGELLGCPIPDVLMGIAHGMTSWMPVRARIGQRPVWSCLVFRPHRQGILGVRRLDQLFFAAASGSTTVTVPLFRFLTTVPVSHQL